MPSSRLYQQFQRLAQQLGCDEREISLAEVAVLLCCTPRNARLLLRRMQDQGWLSWSAEAGRGRRSRLILLDNQESLTRRRLRDLLSQGQLTQAVRLAEGRLDLLTPLLIEQLGQATREGRQILRVPYYRPLPQLLPTDPLRRSEIHLSRQIFNGLTRRNEENGEIEGDLAHHWECLGPCHWRFYLRPAVRFHHGRELGVEDVMESLHALRERPLFAHLARLESPWPRTLDMYLDSPDPLLPHLLAEPVAAILPRELKEEAGFALQPVGTGPYKVVANDPLQLCLEAFDDYFGLRALLDEIDIWMLPELAERLESHLQLGRDSPELGTMRGESELESGCYFLLQDDRSPPLQDPALRQWLTRLLNPIALMGRVAPELQRGWTSALGLLPHWRETLPAEEPRPARLPTRLVLACFNQHLEFEECAGAMAGLLGSQGIELEVRTLDYGRWVSGTDEDVDLWLGTLNLEHEHAFAPYAWLQGTPLLRKVWGGQQRLWQGLTQWRASGAEPGPRALLAEVQRRGWFVPLFHHWLELESRVGVHGVRMTALGWFDFRSAWLRPEQGMAAAETGDGSHPDAGTLES
ncbi:HTH-type transcriptional regulator SgrR [Aeromonas media]|uniref:HTH-type transcriptional regulator SgrR n=1 Tax=Aeromonas media TaxID=651 RepID=A0AAE7DT29_AERME|nr:HTH-type transcriptional regulator SgrR [Aeromonas media]MBS4639688.1 HTH-type transcriptional regulator SgrR [Aeromonas media]MCV3287714.1 HTH-type transcriptional regulator SgrR [Aeromonas media]QJT32267.1 HTH-type transcriptional regulator SgrR [Aeromonas media]QJT33263.1 HTH-type transcriptional regulator SgrR [Aeromonas media]QJT38835.1 HTH-type transcriptional regulator SgrR [Aeromonas media]